MLHYADLLHINKVLIFDTVCKLHVYQAVEHKLRIIGTITHF